MVVELAGVELAEDELIDAGSLAGSVDGVAGGATDEGWAERRQQRFSRGTAFGGPELAGVTADSVALDKGARRDVLGVTLATALLERATRELGSALELERDN